MCANLSLIYVIKWYGRYIKKYVFLCKILQERQIDTWNLHFSAFRFLLRFFLLSESTKLFLLPRYNRCKISKMFLNTSSSSQSYINSWIFLGEDHICILYSKNSIILNNSILFYPILIFPVVYFCLWFNNQIIFKNNIKYSMIYKWKIFLVNLHLSVLK